MNGDNQASRDTTPRPDFYRTMAAPEPLRPFIDSFWLYEGYRPDHGMERVLPTGTLEMVIPLAGQRLAWQELTGETQSCADALVCGPRRSAFDVPTDQQTQLAGVHFLPGGAWPFFGISMDELAERNTPLGDLSLGAASDLAARLAETTCPAGRFSALSAFFLERLALARAPHRAVQAALHRLHAHDGDTESISSIVASSGLSHRRFVGLFRREVGLTPRDLARVGRFQRALSLSRNRPTANATELALDAGYFDQSHWLLECRKLTELPASSLLATARGETPLPDEEKGQMLPIGG